MKLIPTNYIRINVCKGRQLEQKFTDEKGNEKWLPVFEYHECKNKKNQRK